MSTEPDQIRPAIARLEPTNSQQPDPNDTRPSEFSADPYTDNRQAFDWKSRYDSSAVKCIRWEVGYLLTVLSIAMIFAGLAMAIEPSRIVLSTGFLTVDAVDESSPVAARVVVDFRFLALFFLGIIGGCTFSAKWLIHACAKGKWHLDRRYWRTLTPLLGGVYACVMLTLFNSGLIGGASSPAERPFALTAAFAFIVGYFADGVSGLLSNVANAVFGTLEKK